MREVLLFSFFVFLHEVVSAGEGALMFLNRILKQPYLIGYVLDYFLLQGQHPFQFHILLLQFLHFCLQQLLSLAGTCSFLPLLDVGLRLLSLVLVLQIGRDVFVDWRFGVRSIVFQWRLGPRWVFGRCWVFFDGFEAVFSPGEISVVWGFRFLFFGLGDADGRNGGDHEIVAGFGLGRNDSGVELFAALEFQLFGVSALCQADRVALPADEICNLLILKRNQWKRLSPLFIIADAKLSVCIFAPNPALALLCDPKPIITTQLYLLEPLRNLAKLRRQFIIILQVFPPDIHPAIFCNAQEVLSCCNIHKLLLEVAQHCLSWFFLATAVYLPVFCEEVIAIEGSSDILDLLPGEPLYNLRI